MSSRWGGLPPLLMPMAGNTYQVLNFNLLSVAIVQRADAGIDSTAQDPQLFNVVPHLPADGVLVLCGERLHLLNSSLQLFRHGTEYTIPCA